MGYWSDNAYSGELVDGAGNVVTGTYSGQWYRFYSNGHYVIRSSAKARSLGA